MFLHEHSAFADLIAIVSADRGIPEALVEKDYWVTHALWSLQDSGLVVWFKGGTSLSKGFGLIQRFSEDLDLKLDGSDLPKVTSWTSEGTKAVASRQAYFSKILERINVPGAEIEELRGLRDDPWRSVVLAVKYPTKSSKKLPAIIRPFVQLEIGSARVVPGQSKRISSWAYDYAVVKDPRFKEELVDNCPTIHCVDPAVTLLEKVEAIAKRYKREPFDPASFVRHYEDSCGILAGYSDLPPHGQLIELLEQLLSTKDIKNWPSPDDSAYKPDSNSEKWRELAESWKAIQPLFWGERISLEECARRLADLLARVQRK